MTSISRITRTEPLLRFPEFKDKWEPKKLDKCIIEKNQIGSEDLPLYSLTIENGVTEKTERYERAFLVKNEKDAYKVMEQNDFAYNPMNLRLGALARHSQGFRVKVSRYYNIFAARDSVSTDFLELLLTNFWSMKYYNRMATGSLEEKKRVHFIDFLNFIFPFPSFPEQQKIATFVGTVNAKLDVLRRKRELLARYKRGVMQKLFAQQIRFTQDDGRPFPDWKTKKLGKIASFKKGKGISKGDINQNGINPCIRYGELYTDYDEVITHIKSFTNIDLTGMILSKINDVIIPSSGEDRFDIAQAACVQVSNVMLGGDLNILRGNFNGIFLAYYLNTAKRHDIARVAQGNSVVHLYSSQLAALTIEIPCIDEQTKIAYFLTAIDNKITAVDQQIERIETFKKGLLQQMFV